MGNLFVEITLIICLASILSIIFRVAKQPQILAYILTGMLIIPFKIVDTHNLEVLHNFSDVGITLLLFLLGLELKLGELKSIGKVALVSGILQILLTLAIGFGAISLFGFPLQQALYIALAFTFSSTIIVVKLLADKKDTHSLYAKITVGLLLVQDFFAILFLMILAGYRPAASWDLVLASLVLVIFKAAILFALIIYLSRTLVPQLIHIIARSEESLFLFSLAWVFGLSALVSLPFIGFSIEIGGFLAGIALANAAENIQIAARVRPLRDFFITLFFVFLGSQLVFSHIEQIIFPAIVLSLFVLIGKPIIMMAIMGAMGYKKRTAFLTSISIGQVSEFSLVILLLGNSLGHIPTSTISLVTLVAIISFTLSSYLIMHTENIYKRIQKYLTVFEWRKETKEHVIKKQELIDHIVLIGGTRMGQTILESLGDTADIVVVDFNPDVITSLSEKGIHAVFGDIMDADIASHVSIHKAKIVISTISNFENNIALIKSVHHGNKETKIIVMAYDTQEAKIFYEIGADYVVLPHIAGGRQIARTIKNEDLETLTTMAEKDKKNLI